MANTRRSTLSAGQSRDAARASTTATRRPACPSAQASVAPTWLPPMMMSSYGWVMVISQSGVGATP